MICVLETPIDLAIFVALGNLLANKKGYRGDQPAVCALTWPGPFLASMAPGEKLYLLGHGSEVMIGGKWPKVLARKLLDAGLPAHIKHIKVSTCRSGQGDNPPCKQLMKEIIEQSTEDASKPPEFGLPAKSVIKLPVVGFKGVVVTTDKGETRAKDDVKRDQKMSEYKAIFTTDLDAKSKLWETRAASLKTDTQEALIENAFEMRVASQELFVKFHEFNPSVLLDVSDKTNYKYKAVPG